MNVAEGGLIIGILLLLLLLIVVMAVIVMCVERYRWHGGVCRRCGSKWIMHAEDIDGSRMYVDGSGHNLIIRHDSDCN